MSADIELLAGEATQALEVLDRLVLGIPPDCRSRPTPREGLDVGGLVAHVTAQVALVPTMLARRPAREPHSDPSDPVEAWVRATAYADAALREEIDPADPVVAGYLSGLSAELWACAHDLAEATGATEYVIRTMPEERT